MSHAARGRSIFLYFTRLKCDAFPHKEKHPSTSVRGTISTCAPRQVNTPDYARIAMACKSDSARETTQPAIGKVGLERQINVERLGSRGARA